MTSFTSTNSLSMLGGDDYGDVSASLGDVSASLGDVSATLSGFVTLDTDQTVTGIKTISGGLVANGFTISPAELGYIDGLTSNVQTQINTKATDTNLVHILGTETVTGDKTLSGTTTISGSIIANGFAISQTEMGYIDGLTSNAQAQLTSSLHNSGFENASGTKIFDDFILFNGGVDTTFIRSDRYYSRQGYLPILSLQVAGTPNNASSSSGTVTWSPSWTLGATNDEYNWCCPCYATMYSMTLMFDSDQTASGTATFDFYKKASNAVAQVLYATESVAWSCNSATTYTRNNVFANTAIKYEVGDILQVKYSGMPSASEWGAIFYAYQT